MTNRISRRAIACALFATTAVCGLVAQPASAQQYQPQKYRAVDANDVDVTWGDFIMNFVEGSIGSGEAKLDLVRNAQYRPGAYDSNSNNLNWDRIWLSHSSTSNIINIGPRLEKFTMTGTLPSGSTLSGSGSSYTYTTSDGTRIDFQDPTASTDSSSQYCNGTQTQCTLLPVSITSPDGRQVTIRWDVNTYYLNSGGGGLDCPIDPSDPSCTGGLGSVSYDTRISAVSNSFGYRIAFTYVTDLGSSTTPSAEDWHKRTRADFFNDSVSTTTPQSSVTYSYPSSGVTQVTDTGGRVWRFTGTIDRVTGIRRPGASSDTTTISYDVNAKVSSVTNEGVTTNYNRAVSGSTATMIVTDPLSHTKVVTSDLTVGRPTAIVDELSRTTGFQYDSNGRLTRTTQPEGNYVQYTYDARGNVTEARAGAKSGSGLSDIVTTASYDPTCTNPVTCNQPNSTTDARGNVTDYTYDSTHGGVLTVTAPAPTTGATRPQTRYSYTLTNGEYRLTGVSACQTGSSCIGTADEVKSTIAYDSSGNVTSLSKGNGSGTLTATQAMTYDAVGNLLTVDGPLSGSADTSRFRYDAARELIGVTSPDPDGAGALRMRAIKYSYNSDGTRQLEQLGTVTDQSDAAWASFSEAYRHFTGYDSNARLIRETLWSNGADYAVLDHVYDALGRLSCSVSYMDPAQWGPQATTCAPLQTNGPNGPDRVTQIVYDAASEPTQLKAAVGTSDAATERTLTYTNNGMVTSLTDAENNLTTYEYDGFDRLAKTHYPSTTKGAGTSSTTDYEQLGYDASSNVTSRRLRSGSSIAFTYDNLDRVTLKDLPAPESDVSYGYDLLGRTTGASQNGYNLSFGYDALSRQTSDGQGWGTISRSFDLAGRMTRTTWQDGFYVDYDRLVTGELSKARENGATSGVGVLATYAYDDLGRRTGVTFGNGASQAFTYDAVSRLASLTNDLSGTTNDLSVTFAYNPASQITQSVRTGDAYAWTGHGNGSTAFTQNGLNQQITVGGTSASHDSNGNLTFEPQSGKTYAYDSENRLKTASGGVSVYYDPVGRIAEYDTNASSRFMSDGPEVAVEIDNPNSNIVRRFVRGDGPDELIAWYEGSGTTGRRFASLDERGSVVAATDGSGSLVGINTYDEYGKPGASNVGRFQYTGQMWLPDANLYYYKARHYAAQIGRFLQTDPIGPVDSPNLYAYALNDPVNYVDPFGLCIGGGGSVGVGIDGGPIVNCPRIPGFGGGAGGGGGGGSDWSGHRIQLDEPIGPGGGGGSDCPIILKECLASQPPPASPPPPAQKPPIFACNVPGAPKCPVPPAPPRPKPKTDVLTCAFERLGTPTLDRYTRDVRRAAIGQMRIQGFGDLKGGNSSIGGTILFDLGVEIVNCLKR